MGAIAEHSAAQVGTKQATKAKRRGLTNLDKANELLMTALDQRAGNNGFTVEQVGAAYLQYVENVLVPQIRSGSDDSLPLLDSADSLSAGSKGDPSTPPPVQNTPSRAELLGEKLEKLFGNRAETVLNILGHAANADLSLIDGLLAQETARVKNGETLVKSGGRYAFQADLDTLKTKRDYESSFLDLLAYLHGGAYPDAYSISTHVQEAKKIIDSLRGATTPINTMADKVFKRLTAELAHNPGESAEDYLDRIETLIKAEREKEIVEIIENASKTKMGCETFDKYVERVVNELNTQAAKTTGKTGDYSKLLDEVGKAIGCLRNRESDDTYFVRVKDALSKLVNGYDTYNLQHEKALEYCKVNKVSGINEANDTFADILHKACAHFNSTTTAKGGVKGWVKTTFTK